MPLAICSFTKKRGLQNGVLARAKYLRRWGCMPGIVYMASDLALLSGRTFRVAWGHALAPSNSGRRRARVCARADAALCRRLKGRDVVYICACLG